MDFDALASRFVDLEDLEPRSRAQLHRTLLDTFDWRLYRAGLTLEVERTGGATNLSLRDQHGAVIDRHRVADAPRFADDLPTGPVRDTVAAELSVRALLPRAELTVEQHTHAALNHDAKTVARITLERVATNRIELAPRVQVESLRGYERAAGRRAELLAAELGLTAAVDRDDVERAFRAAGAVPGDYSSKFGVALEPEGPAQRAVVALFTALLDAMERNEGGVRDDIDTEFLHDFRVAIRRTRSLLPVARRCMPPDAIAPFVADFRTFARATGTQRDLDVLLLGFDELTTGVAGEWRDDLGKLVPHIVAARDQARRDLLAALDGPWPRLRDRWRRLLTEPSAEIAGLPDADHTAAELARGAITDAHRAMVKSGRRITEHSPADALHTLRKKAKVLRYELEAFTSVLPAEELHDATRDLRRLQDVLGEFQDFDVQVHTIRAFAEQLHGADDGSVDLLLAMGALRAHARDEREQLRARSLDAFRRFDSPGTRRRFRRLVAPHEPSRDRPEADQSTAAGDGAAEAEEAP